MCVSPQLLPSGSQVACRHCRLCLDNRVNDLVGRCIAEQSTSDRTFSVTLTYGQDVPNSAVLTYSDVQIFLKSLRNDGFKVRYICAGEYGTKKGRAHWHIVLFFKGKVPDVPLEKRISWKYWSHGFSYFQEPDYGGFRYAMKYALKQEGSEASVRSLAMSKKPPLGYAFFMRLADDLVARSLPCHNPEYAFAHVKDRKGRARRYWLRGRMRELFFDRYQMMWRMIHKSEPPVTEYLEEQYFDRIFRDLKVRDVSSFEADLDLKRPRRVYIEPDYEPEDTPFGDLGYLVVHSGADTVLVSVVSAPRASMSPTVYIFPEGGLPWAITIGNSVHVVRQLLQTGLPNTC